MPLTSKLPWRRWRETPTERRFSARRFAFASNQWIPCEYSELRKGDVFRAYAPDGKPINPLTQEILETDGDIVGYCWNDPIKGYDRNEGYAVEISVGSYDEIMREASQ